MDVETQRLAGFQNLFVRLAVDQATRKAFFADPATVGRRFGVEGREQNR